MKAITKRIERAIEKHKQATDKQFGLEIEIATQKGLTRAVMSSNTTLRRALEKACDNMYHDCPWEDVSWERFLDCHVECDDRDTIGHDCWMQYYMEDK